LKVFKTAFDSGARHQLREHERPEAMYRLVEPKPNARVYIKKRRAEPTSPSVSDEGANRGSPEF